MLHLLGKTCGRLESLAVQLGSEQIQVSLLIMLIIQFTELLLSFEYRHESPLHN